MITHMFSLIASKPAKAKFFCNLYHSDEIWIHITEMKDQIQKLVAFCRYWDIPEEGSPTLQVIRQQKDRSEWKVRGKQNVRVKREVRRYLLYPVAGPECWNHCQCGMGDNVKKRWVKNTLISKCNSSGNVCILPTFQLCPPAVCIYLHHFVCFHAWNFADTSILGNTI